MSARGPFDFEEAVWRELERMREAMDRQATAVERAVERFGSDVDDLRDEVSQVKISVAELRRDPPRPSTSRGLARDGGLTISAATVGALLAALAQWVAPHTAPAPQMPPHSAPAVVP